MTPTIYIRISIVTCKFLWLELELKKITRIPTNFYIGPESAFFQAPIRDSKTFFQGPEDVFFQAPVNAFFPDKCVLSNSNKCVFQAPVNVFFQGSLNVIFQVPVNAFFPGKYVLSRAGKCVLSRADKCVQEGISVV